MVVGIAGSLFLIVFLLLQFGKNIKSIEEVFTISSSTSPDALNLESQDALGYKNSEKGFSLYYPEELSVEEYDEGGGVETIVFSNTVSGNEFQIFITPYSEDFISEERFRLDIPSGVIEDQKDVSIGGVPGIIFFSEHPLMGPTREVWFIHKGFLYEVTTYKALDAWIADIIKTWVFI